MQSKKTHIKPDSVKIIESPRDAFQSIDAFIPTEIKVEYINLLLKVGVDVIDFGSIVSQKAIPQLSDTVEVLRKLDLDSSGSELMLLVPNLRGGEIACRYEEIDIISYPFSISSTFLKRNINKTKEQAFDELRKLNDLCERSSKKCLPYITMGFGNPYKDRWHIDILMEWIEKISKEDIVEMSLSDIVGVADKAQIKSVYQQIQTEFPEINFGLHLHSKKNEAIEKVEAAYKSGVRIFDTVLGGFGGCPLTGYELLGNLNTSSLIEFLEDKKLNLNLDKNKLLEAIKYSSKLIS